MIRLDETNEGNYYISVSPENNRNTNGLLQFLKGKGFIVADSDEEELLIDIDSVLHKLSLNELRNIISEYSKCVVSYFVVDPSESNGRYYG